jgi:hypothetical protein|tara:strand:+ start:6428 stop:7294 length:867 start_codon:yes stop_codon:yes gene_type:complete
MDRLGSDDDSTPTGGADAPAMAVEAPTGGSQPLSFSIPTDHIELPSRGVYYPENHPLHGQDTIEIKYMTAKEEDILTSPSLLKKGLTIERLLRSIILDKTIDPQHLLVGDRNAIIVGARVTGYGSEYKANITCPACTTINQLDVELSELKVHAGGEEAKEGYVVKHLEGSEYIITLPKSGFSVTVRLLTGRDEKIISDYVQKRKKHKLEESTLTTQLKTLIVAVNGDRRTNVIEEFVDFIPAFDSRYIRNAYAKVNPNLNMEYPFVCIECDHDTAVEVPLSAEFFWPK